MKNIDRLINELNSEKNLPKMAFRRNSTVYVLVSTMNNIVACYMSQNKKPIEILVERAKDFVEENPQTPDNEKYYKIVDQILSELSA